MRGRGVLCALVALVVMCLAARSAGGDDALPSTPSAPPAPTVIGNAGYLHLRSSAHVQTEGGSDLRLPPGYYLDEPNWHKLDDEVRRLQEQETRLAAENKSLRSTVSSWQPGWKTLLGVLVTGIGTGIYLHSKL